MPLALLLCLVVGVTDGDTLTARCGTEPRQTLTIRLAEIDAPDERLRLLQLPGVRVQDQM